MATISQLNINGSLYDIRDDSKLPLSGGTLTGIVISSNTVSFYFTGSGSGTYDKAAMYVNSAGITFETPRTSDSNTADVLPFLVNTRGGQGAPLRAGSVYQNGHQVLNADEIKGLPFCKVYYAGSGDASFGGTVVWNQVLKDTHSAYSTSTGHYTCPVDGIYLVSVNYFSNSISNANARPRIRHTNSSGTEITGDGIQLSGQNACSVNDVFYCSKNDHLYFGAQTSNFTISLYAALNHNSMTITCLRPL